MSALPSAGGGYGALHLVGHPDACNGVVSEFLPPTAAAPSVPGANKRKRRPAGTPDPGAEVVALSPKTLMESDRYVCEICNQGFQRDQNLQMHRRRHKVPWKLLKRPSLGTNKRVYICPERSCLHHDPAHALGDLVGIKKHYRRKHCTEKQWKCDKCSKGYAVQSDYKAHLKTCGTRGHCCDCGRVFSRVESFIEHQDTCSAVKHKAMQSGGGSERLKSGAPHQGTDRNSTGSPSQSSDTTQAMSFAQSGMSDTAKTVTDEHSRRIQESQAASPSAAAMPPWLTDRRSELELLPSKHRLPTDHTHSEKLLVQGTRPRADPAKSHVTRCSSINFPYPDVSCPESKSTLEPSREGPSLQLSIGPYGAEVASSSPSPYVDTKPSFSAVEREAALALAYRQRQASAGVIPGSRSGANDLALSIPTTLAPPGKQPEMDHGVSLSGFLMQAVRRLGSESNAGGHQSTKKLHQSNHRTEMVANYNPCAAGSTSSYHEDLAANAHESEPSGPRMLSRRGFTNSQLEPATSSVISSRQALDIAETDHLFAANSKSLDEAFRSQKQMAAGALAEANQASEQARTDMNAAWSDLVRVRRSKDEARHECDEAQRDLARAEILKREAREQLQFASAERAYAERAREIAKRQIEISEAELARAKRLREQAQAELSSAAGSLGNISEPTFCHSCKSAIENIPPRKATPTSPASSTWSFMTPATSTDQLQAGGTRVSGTGVNIWSADQLHLWPAGYRSMSTSAASMAIEESPPCGGNNNNPVVTVGESISPVLVSRPGVQSDRDFITPKLDLDLN